MDSLIRNLQRAPDTVRRNSALAAVPGRAERGEACRDGKGNGSARSFESRHGGSAGGHMASSQQDTNRRKEITDMFTTKTPTITQLLPLRLRTEFFRRIFFHRPKRRHQQRPFRFFDAGVDYSKL